MNEDAQKLVIQSLSTMVAEKRQRLHMLGMMNTATDEAGRMQQRMDYSQAQADLFNAEGALRDALVRRGSV